MAASEPYRGRLAPELVRWCREAAADARTTALVRIRGTAPVDEVVRRLEAAGADVTSAGPGVITVVAGCGAMERLDQVEDVVAIEPPRRFQLKLGR